MNITSKQLKDRGFTFHMQGDEPHNCIEARDKIGNLIAWRNSNMWPRGDERDWELAPAGKKALALASMGEGAVEQKARQMYVESVSNHPQIHCNRFAVWPELQEKTREVWRDKARAALSALNDGEK